ncbi:hypothetical protein P7C73_g272, partial [Tremellales sp. Uapishka_1]
MDALIRQILPYIPENLQPILLDPPTFARPSTFIPVIKAILPYSQLFIVLIAVYVVWSVLSGVMGYFSRFFRFAMKLGPIFAFLAWIMSSSGQGGMGEIFEVAKQYAGLAPAAGNGERSPGLASLAGLFGSNSATNSKKKTRSKSASNWENLLNANAKTGHTASRDGDRKDGEPDILSSLLKSATGLGEGGDGGLQDVVQGYVKTALAKAAGLEWLMGGGGDAKPAKGKGGKK